MVSPEVKYGVPELKFAACQGEAPAGPVGTMAIHDQLGLPEIDPQ